MKLVPLYKIEHQMKKAGSAGHQTGIFLEVPLQGFKSLKFFVFN